MKKLIWGDVIIVVIGLIALAAFKKQPQETSKKITIGVLSILSGDGAAWGESAKKGIDLAVEEWRNSHRDRVIELIYEDTAGEGKQAETAHQKMVPVDNI